jgi:hypothetical protein
MALTPGSAGSRRLTVVTEPKHVEPVRAAERVVAPWPLVSVFGVRGQGEARAFAELVQRSAAASGCAIELCESEPPVEAAAVVGVGVTWPARYRSLITVAITEGLPWVHWSADARALRELVDVALAEVRPAVEQVIASRVVASR